MLQKGKKSVIMSRNIRGQKGFTLIELMIVVAIIGILAGIAIPNFLQYQLKAKTAEAQTNIQAIKTGMATITAEMGCAPSIAPAPLAVPPAGGTRTQWPAAALIPTSLLCAAPPAAASYVGTFADIGFTPSGAVRYSYSVASFPASTPAALGANGCTNPTALPVGAGAPGNVGWLVGAVGDLDGAGPTAGFQVGDAGSSLNCNPGQF
jgi:type IV pilus assembly protein PilA